MNLNSDKVNIEKSADEIFEFLSKVENFEHIMPENTEKFKAGHDSFLFALKGMPEIRLNLQEKTAPNKLVFASASDKFKFTLTGHINAITEKSSEVQLVFDGEFNAMMAMMIKGPLQKFIDKLSGNIAQLK